MFPQIAHEGADLGVALFMEALFPYLLPYLILTGWFIRLTAKPAPKKPILLYLKTYAISAVGGFPTGAATISHLTRQGELSHVQAAYLLGICHVPSPLFLIGFVGYDLFNDTSFSWQYLLLIHGFSFVLLFFLPKIVPTTVSPVNQPIQKDPFPFSNSVKDSMPTVFIVAATIIFFTTIYSVFLHSTDTLFNSFPPSFKLVIASVLEMTNGLFLLHEHLEGHALIYTSVILLTTQSLSIHLQVIVLAKTASISIRPYVMIRLFYSVMIPLLYGLFFL